MSKKDKLKDLMKKRQAVQPVDRYNSATSNTNDAGKKPKKIKTNEVKKVRATFVVKNPLLEDIKNWAYTDRRTISAVVNEAFSKYLENKEGEPLKRRQKSL
jgi:hypothetical protein